MAIYRERPTPRKARAVWDHATALRGRPPSSLHKNPNCWGGASLSANAWGWWVAEWDDIPEGPRRYETIHPKVVT